MKIVIDLPEEVTEWFKGKGFIPIGQYLTVDEAMKKAEPLSEILDKMERTSEKAETKAYFDGQAYGWEEGRKDLCDKISAEITEKAFTEEIFDEDVFRSTYTENMTREEAEEESVIDTEIVKLSDILEIIDKYKGASK